jgi:TetR/AcrR family transcriptional regulator, transcriptional repressor for nem operon
LRKSRKEATETRERIVTVAAKELNKGGIEGTALAKIMTAAGLTHGGFYKHFVSKNHLIADAMERAFDRSFPLAEGLKSNRPFEAIVDGYLSLRHRDELEQACPLSALGSELRFCSPDVREVVSKGIERFVSVLQTGLPNLSATETRAKARAMVAAMVGAVLLSRIVTDGKISARFLKDTKNFIVDS